MLQLRITTELLNGEKRLGGLCAIVERESQLKQVIDHLQEQSVQMLVNGWVLQENGEMECQYCKKQTKGFERGVYNEHNKNFDPRKDPCECKLFPIEQ